MKEPSVGWPSLVGATRYEFLMQIRRKALWITFAAFSLFVFAVTAITLAPWSGAFDGIPLAHTIANWSLAVQLLHPVAFGMLLADRLPRDRRTGAHEVLDTLPAPPGGRFVGKYLGATLATLVPVALIWALGILYVVADQGSLEAVPLGVAAFLTVNVPGLLFVAAFSVACPAILWVPLYQFLFVGYWFWGNLIPSDFDIPTLSRTILTPFGEYMANGFFGTEQTAVRATVSEGVASIGLLLALAALALYTAHRYLRWRRERL